MMPDKTSTDDPVEFGVVQPETPSFLRRTGVLIALAICAAGLWWMWERIAYCMSFPTICGTDPYTRMYYRDEVVVGIFGRKWLPLVQLVQNRIFAMGGGVHEIKIFMAIVGTLFLAIAFLYGARRFGFLAGVVWFLLLSVDPDVFFVTVTPYQEIIFYSAALLMVWRVGRISSRPVFRECLELIGLAIIALLCRYEAMVLSAAVAFAAGLHWYRAGGVRRWTPFVLLAFGLIALPATGYLIYSELRDDYHSSLGGEVDPEKFIITADAVISLIFAPVFLKYFWVAAMGLAVSLVRKQRFGPDQIAFNVYIVLFVLTYILVCPYIPVRNRRFHVPLVIWLYLYSSLMLCYVAAWVGRRSNARRIGAWLLVAALVGPHCYFEWQRLRRDIGHNMLQHRHDAEVGTFVDRTLGDRERFLIHWKRGNHYGHPTRANMRLAGYLNGPGHRFLYRDSPDVRRLRQRLTFVTGNACGGMLVGKKGDDDEAALVRALRARYKGELRKAPFLNGWTYYYWPDGAPSVFADAGDRIAIGTDFLGDYRSCVVAGEMDRAFVQDVRWFPALGDRGFQLFCKTTKPGQLVELSIAVDAPVTGKLRVGLSTADDYGIVSVWVDGERIATENLYERSESRRVVESASKEWTAGEHRLQIRVEGKDAASGRHYFGVNSIDFTP